MRHLDRSVRILVNRERVDHPDGLLVMQALKLSDDLPVEFGMVEAHDDQLNRSDCHRSRLSNQSVCGLPERRRSTEARRSKCNQVSQASGPNNMRGRTTLVLVPTTLGQLPTAARPAASRPFRHEQAH